MCVSVESCIKFLNIDITVEVLYFVIGTIMKNEVILKIDRKNFIQTFLSHSKKSNYGHYDYNSYWLKRLQ